MKKVLFALGCAVMALALAWPGAAQAGARVEVRLAPLGRSYSPPPLARKQGWLTISNRDWHSYSVVVDRKGKLFLYRADQGYGGVVIPSGATVTLALERDTYDAYGNNGEKLKVRVREGRTTSLSLEPFGYVGATGLRVSANDGERVRSEVLFNDYAPPVVIQRPPAVIVNRPPPPPPVIVTRPPVVVAPRPPPHRPPAHRPPPPRGKKNSGWGITLDYRR